MTCNWRYRIHLVRWVRRLDFLLGFWVYQTRRLPLSLISDQAWPPNAMCYFLSPLSFGLQLEAPLNYCFWIWFRLNLWNRCWESRRSYSEQHLLSFCFHLSWFVCCSTFVRRMFLLWWIFVDAILRFGLDSVLRQKVRFFGFCHRQCSNTPFSSIFVGQCFPCLN